MDTETETPETAQEVQAPASNGVGTSILDEARELRRKALEGNERRLVIDVPGYANRLAVIYHYPEGGYQRAVKALDREADEKLPNAQLEGSADLLVACCASVVGRTPAGDLIDLRTSAPLGPNETPELPVEPLRFTAALAEALQIDVPAEVQAKARFIVRSLFSPRGHSTGVYGGDMAVIATSNAVFAWLKGAEVQIDEDLAGE